MNLKELLDMSPAGMQARRDAALRRMGQPISQARGTVTTAEASAGQVVREYTSVQDMQKGIAKMARDGWRVQGAPTSYQPRAGVGRVVALGIFAAIFKPKVRWVVTYTR